jgi:methyltransferase
MTRPLLLFCVVFGAMLVEARRAAANERAQFARGGVEPKYDIYPFMQVAYPGVFLAMIGEGLIRPAPPTAVLVLGIVVFAAGKLLKWWAILTLGPFWTFRVIAVPGSTVVANGPYRYLRHPNYVGVIGELVGAALMAGAPVAGPLGTALFAGVIAVRLKVETRWLRKVLG